MNKGFTLIELLVVITIISILTVVTVGQFQTAKKKANDVARKGDLNAVSKSLQMYYNDYGVFPDPATIVWGTVFQDNASTPYVYMKKLPRENYTAIPYCYQISADKKKFGLYAMLENKLDKECNNASNINYTYSCTMGGVTRTYCYGITSPNTSLNNDGSLQ